MEGFQKTPNQEGKGYEKVLQQDGDRNFVVDPKEMRGAETMDLLSQEDINQIIDELAKPDLHPSLKKAFKVVLRNKGIELEEVDSESNPTLH